MNTVVINYSAATYVYDQKYSEKNSYVVSCLLSICKMFAEDNELPFDPVKIQDEHPVEYVMIMAQALYKASDEYCKNKSFDMAVTNVCVEFLWPALEDFS